MGAATVLWRRVGGAADRDAEVREEARRSMPQSCLSVFVARIARPLGLIGTVALLVLGVVIFAAVVARQFGIAIVGADETAQLLLVFMVFLAMTVTQSQGGHVRMEAFVTQLPPWARRIADLLSLVICLGMSALILYGTTLDAWAAYRDGEYQYGTIQFPLWPAKAAVSFGVLVFSIHLLLELLAFVRPSVHRQEAAAPLGRVESSP
jgi:TRAP-type C4-dicarboxylate transport system permease small subunit